MRIWTWQDHAALQELSATGILRGQQHRIMEPAFAPAYAWLRQQMHQRIPGYSGGQPLWFWTEQTTAWHCRPRRSMGKNSVLLVAEVPAERLLVSDFSAWHCVLNDWYLPADAAEDDCELKPLTKEQSWERIFALDLWRQSDGYLSSGDQPQVVCEYLKKDELRLIRTIGCN